MTINVLVTGGAGFVGSNLIEQLVKRNNSTMSYKIVSLDNYFTGSKKNHIQNENVTYIEGNTWDADAIFKNKWHFDIVCHFGEYSRIHQSFNDIQVLYKSIMQGTPIILELVRKWGAKLIYSASSSSLGNNGCDEELSPYAWMKSKMIELIKNYKKWYGLEYQICYFFNVYGPRQIESGKYATVVGVFERQYREQKPLTIVKPGTQSRDFTHINDVVDGLIRTIHTPHIHKEWFFRTYKETKITTLASYFKHKISYIPERKGERKQSCIVQNDTEQLLRWKAKCDLKDYITSIISSHN